jgi:hypothetical protein
MSSYGYRTLQVFSTCDENGMAAILARCVELGLETTGIVTCKPNGGQWISTIPRDSKLGWPEVKEHTDKLHEVVNTCHRHNLVREDTFLHFILLFNYEDERLGVWQSTIDLTNNGINGEA